MTATAARDASYHDFSNEELGRKQRAVLAFIAKYGPITSRQLSEMMGWPVNRITGRVKELRQMDMVKGLDKVFDNETRREVNRWVAIGGFLKLVIRRQFQGSCRSRS